MHEKILIGFNKTSSPRWGTFFFPTTLLFTYIRTFIACNFFVHVSFVSLGEISPKALLIDGDEKFEPYLVGKWFCGGKKIFMTFTELIRL